MLAGGAPVDTSVIVVTHNHREFIDACLRSLADQRPTVPEIVVIDNASTDGTADIVQERHPNVILVRSPNGGFGAGNNLGARLARGTVLAFLNPDTIADPDWI